MVCGQRIADAHCSVQNANVLHGEVIVGQKQPTKHICMNFSQDETAQWSLESVHVHHGQQLQWFGERPGYVGSLGVGDMKDTRLMCFQHARRHGGGSLWAKCNAAGIDKLRQIKKRILKSKSHNKSLQHYSFGQATVAIAEPKACDSDAWMLAAFQRKVPQLRCYLRCLLVLRMCLSNGAAQEMQRLDKYTHDPQADNFGDVGTCQQNRNAYRHRQLINCLANIQFSSDQHFLIRVEFISFSVEAKGVSECASSCACTRDLEVRQGLAAISVSSSQGSMPKIDADLARQANNRMTDQVCGAFKVATAENRFLVLKKQWP